MGYSPEAVARRTGDVVAPSGHAATDSPAAPDKGRGRGAAMKIMLLVVLLLIVGAAGAVLGGAVP